MTYYSIDNIASKKCQLNLLLGQRSNGKSYAVKERVVKKAFLGLGKHIYLRRWGVEIKQQDVTDYYADVPVKKITDGQYDTIDVYRGRIYLANTNEDGSITRGLCIGRTAALASSGHLKSVIQRGEYSDIIYEEFCTKEGFLPSEPDKLQQFIATVFGVQHTGQVWLIGNTVSRINPYFFTWGLRSIKDLQPGQIDVYNLKQEDGSVVNIAVEFCSSINVPSNMFFGEARKNITTGVWETEQEPQIPEDFGKFKVLYRLLYEHDNFLFLLKIIENKKRERLILCAPTEEKPKDPVRTVSNKVSGDPLVTDKLLPLTGGDMLLLDLFKKGKMVFANNLTGADFKAIVNTKHGL